MKILSVNVGLPREVPFREEIVTTGIFKQPIEGQVKLRKLNLDGDVSRVYHTGKLRIYFLI